MSDNPLDPSPDFMQRVRERAYLMWEREGSPEGRADEYWERAWELESMAAHPGAMLLPNPVVAHPDPNAPERVEEAEIQENLGEFPDRFADQGERRPTPMTRTEAREESEQA